MGDWDGLLMGRSSVPTFYLWASHDFYGGRTLSAHQLRTPSTGTAPAPLVPVQRQIHPLFAQFPEAFVVGEFLPHLRQPLGPHETSAALAAPGKAELVLGPVLLGILGIFAAATGLAANVVLLAQAPGMHRSQSSQLLFHLTFFPVCFWNWAATSCIAN